MRYFVIRTENLTRAYGRKRGIENISLQVEPGEVYGLLGSWGAGKSTLIRLLLDGLKPSSGSALVLGIDTQRGSRQIRQMVGYLPGEFALYNHMSVQDYLRHCARQRGLDVIDEGLALAALFHLSPAQRVVQLNEVERRKLGLVQAFMGRPELFILDEPTSGLSPEEVAAFFHLVVQARSRGSTVFFSSSSLLEVERICDRAALLHQGQLVSVERGVQLRARAIRKIEMRFAEPVRLEDFGAVSNIDNLRLEDNRLFCTVHGEPDGLIKAASQHRVTDFLSQQISLEEAFSSYYGIQSPSPQ